MTDTAKHVSEEEYRRSCRELERARDLAEMDTSRMTLAEKIEHKWAIKAAMQRARQ